MTTMTAVTDRGARPARPRLTASQVWDAVTHQSFAVLSHITPAGTPRSSGVIYAVAGGRMFVAVARDSWKARHIGLDGSVAVTVPVRRGGILALLLPIPPATVSFAAVAAIRPAETLDELPALAKLVPPDRRPACTIVEIRPIDYFVTYGLGVPLLRMRDTDLSRCRVPVNPPER
jgi:hypothetical protein